MAGNNGTVHSAANTDDRARTSMMDLWRESILRGAEQRETVTKAQSEARADLERRICSGQADCPTCRNRQYADRSNDGGVSFQAPRHIGAATAGSVVMNHEWEHVASEDKASRESDEPRIVSKSVTLEYAKCPECGRTYVKGGLTKTSSMAVPANSRARKPGALDVSV